MADPKAPPLPNALEAAMQAALSSVEKRQGISPSDPPSMGVAPVELPPPAPVPLAPVDPPKRTPQDAIIEALIKGKQEATEALQQTQREAKDLLEARTRVQAEFENYRKRVNREKQDAGHAANVNLLRELLPVMDNFERALRSVDDKELSSEAANLVNGIKMVKKQMGEALKKVGAVPFVSKGAPFDPVRHEAVAQVPAPGEELPGTVLEEHQTGYVMGEMLLRPAMVVVVGPKT